MPQPYTTINLDGETIYHYVMIITLDKNNNILLLQRIDNKKWESPKGGVDIINGKTEEPYKAAIRELKEETGISTSAIQKLTTIENIRYKSQTQNILVHLTAYTYKVTTIKPQIIINADTTVKADHLQYKWVKLSNVFNYELSTNIFKTILKKYIII